MSFTDNEWQMKQNALTKKKKQLENRLAQLESLRFISNFIWTWTKFSSLCHQHHMLAHTHTHTQKTYYILLMAIFVSRRWRKKVRRVCFQNIYIHHVYILMISFSSHSTYKSKCVYKNKIWQVSKKKLKKWIRRWEKKQQKKMTI